MIKSYLSKKKEEAEIHTKWSHEEVWCMSKGKQEQ